MINRIKNERLTRRCDLCGHVEDLELALLELGYRRKGFEDPRAIVLPPCANCRGTETLIVSWEEPEGPPTAHRLLVNEIAKWLIEQGRVNSVALEQAKTALPARATGTLEVEIPMPTAGGN